jgi:hypothetical protein
VTEFDHRLVPKYSGLILCLLAFIFDALSFFSFNWIESMPEFKSKFSRLGLWGACFNGYVHPEDYVSKDYYGCWFIYWLEYKYIRDWLTPGWFISVQVFACLCFICNIVALIMVLMNFKKIGDQRKRSADSIPILMQLTALLMYMYIVTWVGVMSKDRNWLPRPDHNRVGWSFAMAVMAGFCSAYAFICLSVDYCITHFRDGIKKIREGYYGANGHGLEKKVEMSIMSQNSEPDYIVSAAGSSAKHREQMERLQQHRPHLPSAASSTFGGQGPRPATSYSRLAAGPSLSQLAAPTLTDSTV